MSGGGLEGVNGGKGDIHNTFNNKGLIKNLKKENRLQYILLTLTFLYKY